jgi:hypothetical protein
MDVDRVRLLLVVYHSSLTALDGIPFIINVLNAIRFTARPCRFVPSVGEKGGTL